jgi:dihydroorotate dehydrogenase (NAD+) catalytic subunit
MIHAAKGRISTVVISTALGPSGRGIFPYTLWPAYRRLVQAVKDTGTTVLTKSATRFPRRGNFIPLNPLTWRYIRRLPHMGMLNAYGLTNAGAEVCAQDIKAAAGLGFQVIPNFYPEFAKGTETAVAETLEALALYQRVLRTYFWALELNFSCPNSQEAIRENVRQGLRCTQAVRQRYPELFLIAKISRVHPFEFAQELEKSGASALHGVNTIPYEIIFPEARYGRSPLWRVGGGGVSGGPAFAEAFNYNQTLRKKVSLPLIMGCGVSRRRDVKRYLDIGADAVSLCTLALRHPRHTEKIIITFNG